ncbi:unnamed protein product [Spodoptera littoralis]|uniref:Glucose-methanol-choline oxidoreductase N-terminal domain-containing protein n=1 Tax=Spodoptera littoralis TaxID=7109 RepID=A0A9P0I641_SPOLI|nr:unnamed protein product [Spodoptera littoralis]CAH1641768.1 unnamed protein product [Spodoptera littoralis]
MSNTVWTPPNIGQICPEQQAPLTQCSTTGFVFLSLLTQLYSHSRDDPKNEYPEWQVPSFRDTKPISPEFEAVISQFPEPTLPPLSSSIQDTFFTNKFQNTFKTPMKNWEKVTRVHSRGPGGSRGLSVTSYFPIFDFEKFNKKTDSEESEEFKRDRERYAFENRAKKEDLDMAFDNPFSKYHRDADFDFMKEIFTDSELETSKSDKVEIRKMKKIGSKKRRKRQTSDQYDFIVVGAGSAGCVIANRLSEVKQWKILLIEAGPEEPEVTSVPSFAPVLGRSSIDWNYRTQPEEMTCRAQRGQTCAWLSGRVMGGSSAINYVVYMRGNKKDYDQWAALGNEGWSYREVLYYFKKSENNQNIEAKDIDHHGVGGPLNVERFAYTDPNVVMLVKAFHEKGLPLVDFNGKRQIGTMTTQTTTKDGKRVSANDAFIRPIRHKRPNLTILTGAQVTEVMFKKKVAIGVRYVKDDVIYEVYVSKEVIISAGALNSPKILMLSGIGPKDDLDDLKIPVIMDSKVGYNLQDHVTTEAVLMGLTNMTSTLLPTKEILKTLSSFAKYGTKFDEISATGPLQVTAFYRTKHAGNDQTIPDIQFHFDGRNRRDFYLDPPTYLATNIFPFSSYDSINVRPILLQPASRGYLTLNRTNPVFGQPLIYPRFFTVKDDLDALVAALKYIVKLEKTKAFKENNVKFIRRRVEPCNDHPWGTIKYFSCILKSYTGTIYHPAGTCKMGPRHDENAVVDARLRVYGVQNLRVADASIMPHIVRGNTNAPCMMIGEKVADMIKEDWDVVFFESLVRK